MIAEDIAPFVEAAETGSPEASPGLKLKRVPEIDPAMRVNVRAMTRQVRYPFIALGVPLILLLLFTFGPTAILLIGGMVGDALGCRLPIDAAAGPCPFRGVDLAPFFSVAVAFGYFAFFTIPAGTALLGIWLVVAVIVTLVWGLRRWRANAKDYSN